MNPTELQLAQARPCQGFQGHGRLKLVCRWTHSLKVKMSYHHLLLGPFLKPQPNAPPYGGASAHLI